MRRSYITARAATRLLLTAAPFAPFASLAAQPDRVIRQAFAPSITAIVGAAGFGVRAVESTGGAQFDYNNGITLGVQFDRPLTRRTGLMGTLAVTPLTRVVATQQSSTFDLERAVVAGVDLGIAARLKPAAPLFVYLGGGALLATRRAARDTDGFGADPRATAGVGIDVMRQERAGFRFLYLAHWARPSSPDGTVSQPRSTAFDQTMVVGGRYMLGGGGRDR